MTVSSGKKTHKKHPCHFTVKTRQKNVFLTNYPTIYLS